MLGWAVSGQHWWVIIWQREGERFCKSEKERINEESWGDGENWWRIKMRESMGREREKRFIECFYVGETILIYEMCWDAFDLHVIPTN